MKETPQAELNDFWQKVAPFLQDVKYRRIAVIKKMKEIPPSEKPAFLSDGAPSLKGNTNSPDQVKIIERFISVPENLPPEPEAGVLKAVPLASNFPKEVGLVSENVSSILGKAHETVEDSYHNRIIELIPKADRDASTLKAINSLKINIKEEQLKFIAEVNTISSVEREKGHKRS